MVADLYALVPWQGENGSEDYRIVSAGQDNTVRMWDPYDMTCLKALKEERSELTALTFFAAGNTPITGMQSAGLCEISLLAAEHNPITIMKPVCFSVALHHAYTEKPRGA